MHNLVLVSTFLGLAFVAACSSDPADDGTADGGGSSGAAATCALRDDVAGQYTDSCVQRSYIAEYAGTYQSPTCKLTIDVSGSVPAKFTVVISGASVPGTYEIDWEGGAAGAGNDSYYRFTTDKTYTTTKAVNFNAGEASDGGEDNVSLRVDGLDTGTPTFTGSYAQLRNGVSTDVDCGAYVKQ